MDDGYSRFEIFLNHFHQDTSKMTESVKYKITVVILVILLSSVAFNNWFYVQWINISLRSNIPYNLAADIYAFFRNLTTQKPTECLECLKIYQIFKLEYLLQYLIHETNFHSNSISLVMFTKFYNCINTDGRLITIFLL